MFASFMSLPYLIPRYDNQGGSISLDSLINYEAVKVMLPILNFHLCLS
jgi:hypothetical protein